MTTIADGPAAVPGALQRARDLGRDILRNQPENPGTTVDPASLAQLTRQANGVVAGQQAASDPALRDGQRAQLTGLTPEVPLDQQAAPGSSAGQGSAASASQGKTKGTQRDGR